MKNLLKPITISALACLISSSAFALPEGGTVAHGDIWFQHANEKTLRVVQRDDIGIVDWKTFNIAKGEQFSVIQPNSGSRSLHRIHDANHSQIHGRINSNGNLYLVNSNGFVFGKTATINVGSITATTSNVSNDNFTRNGIKASHIAFDQPGNPNAKIELNDGYLYASRMVSAFIAPTVTGEPKPPIPMEKLKIGNGEAFVLDLFGDGLIFLDTSKQK